MTRRAVKRLRRQVGSLMARLARLEAKEPGAVQAAPAPAAKPASAAKKRPAKGGA